MEVKNLAPRLPHNQTQKLLSGFVLRERKLHFIPVAPGVLARHDRGGLREKRLNYRLFLLELGWISHPLRRAPTALADMIT